jgi:hypothetical protein
MFYRQLKSLFFILDESPFFTDLSIKERESLMKELLKSYPQLLQQAANDPIMGYEASWLPKQNR